MIEPVSSANTPKPAGLTVVIPALNEEQGIGETLTALKQAVAKIPGPVEILVVNDGSSDRTEEVAREAGARTISHPKPGGYGHALKSGILAASYESIAITDADGTYPVEELPKMVELFQKFDMVVGARTGPLYYKKALTSPMRTMFLFLAAWVTGTRIPDPNSGLRLFRRSEILPILPRLPRAFSFTTTLTLIMTLSGRFIHYHYIPYRKRIGRSKVRLVRDALRVGQTMVEVVLTHNPLKMFLILVIPLGLVAIVLGILALWHPGTLLPALIFFSLAVLVFSLGMVSVVALGDRRVR